MDRFEHALYPTHGHLGCHECARVSVQVSNAHIGHVKRLVGEERDGCGRSFTSGCAQGHLVDELRRSGFVFHGRWLCNAGLQPHHRPLTKGPRIRRLEGIPFVDRHRSDAFSPLCYDHPTVHLGMLGRDDADVLRASGDVLEYINTLRIRTLNASEGLYRNAAYPPPLETFFPALSRKITRRAGVVRVLSNVFNFRL